MEQSNNTQNVANVSDQTQMRRECDNSQEVNHLQNPGVLQETGEHVKTMARGATDVGMGAAQGVACLARGAALGVANVAQGTADAVKNTFNASSDPNAGATNPSGATPNVSGGNPSNTSNSN